MNNFCSNCGSKIEQGKSFCSNCGNGIGGNSNDFQNRPKGKGKSIAGFVLGILAILFSIICLLGLDSMEESMLEAITRIEQTYGQISNPNVYYSFGYVLIPLTLALVGLPLSISGLKNKANGFNITGIVLCSISIVISIGVFIFGLTL